MADRISIDKQVKESLLPIIENKKLLGFDMAENTELFVFAMAIGIKIGKRTSLKTKIGWVLSQSIKNNKMSMIYSVALNDLRKEGKENLIDDIDVVYQIAEEYANTGFSYIKSFLEENEMLDSEALTYEALNRLVELSEQMEVKNIITSN